MFDSNFFHNGGCGGVVRFVCGHVGLWFDIEGNTVEDERRRCGYPERFTLPYFCKSAVRFSRDEKLVNFWFLHVLDDPRDDTRCRFGDK